VNSLSLNFDWLTSGNDAPEIQKTMGMFGLKVGEISLTRNEDIWSQTIRDTVLVSAYPLAAWMVASWWRLLYEPLPLGTKPSVDWRMAHELTAANQGFIWPRVIFASDTEFMQIWCRTSNPSRQQSIRYINGLDQPVLLPLLEFEQKAKIFIESVLSRLNATGLSETSLSGLWREVQEEFSDPESTQYRRCEAELGFDPDECPESVINDALHLNRQMGDSTFSEVAPAYSQELSEAKPLSAKIADITEEPGLDGKPEVSVDDFSGSPSKAPWQKAKELASYLRKQIDMGENPVNDEILYELLGLQKSEYESWTPANRQPVSIAVPLETARFKFYPRKKHPIAKRFELARFLGDYLLYSNQGNSWLASTDLRTSRQKYQRAFAAEFLCPLKSLQSYLDNDYSESAIEDAAVYFNVSQKTVESILANNGLIVAPQSIHDLETSLPY
jgi:hypothetical protein